MRIIRKSHHLVGLVLEEWLDDPSTGKDVLLRNLGGGLENDAEDDDDGDYGKTSDITGSRESEEYWPSLFDALADVDEEKKAKSATNGVAVSIDGRDTISIDEIEHGRVIDCAISSAIIGLGFEERTARSAQRLVGAWSPEAVYAVQYQEVGKSQEILQSFHELQPKIELMNYNKVAGDSFLHVAGPALIDVTGLAKPVIFHAVRQVLRRYGTVLIMHTEAEKYYPSNEDLERLVIAQETHDRYHFFEIIADIMTGEEKPYELVPLLQDDDDKTRRRVLYAFASSKHERLLSLLDQREFDRLELVAPRGDSRRSRVAREIADIAATDNSNSNVTLMSSDDLGNNVNSLLHGFEECYVRRGLNFEVGLTGSKMETVAAAAVSAVRKMTQVWYVRPQRFDPERFTEGAGVSRFFKITKNGGGT